MYSAALLLKAEQVTSDLLSPQAHLPQHRGICSCTPAPGCSTANCLYHCSPEGFLQQHVGHYNGLCIVAVLMENPVVHLQVKAQWTVAQQGETGSVLQVDCLMVGEQKGSLQLTAKACPALPRLVQAMDSMQAHSTALAVAALTCGVDAAKAVLRESEHPLPPPSACRLLIAVLLLTGWCILLPGPAARPCCQALLPGPALVQGTYSSCCGSAGMWHGCSQGCAAQE